MAQSRLIRSLSLIQTHRLQNHYFTSFLISFFISSLLSLLRPARTQSDYERSPGDAFWLRSLAPTIPFVLKLWKSSQVFHGCLGIRVLKGFCTSITNALNPATIFFPYIPFLHSLPHSLPLLTHHLLATYTNVNNLSCHSIISLFFFQSNRENKKD